MEDGASADTLSVANNQIRNVGLRGVRKDWPVAGIQVVNVRSAEVADNAVTGVGLDAQFPWFGGISLFACNAARVAGNDVRDVGLRGDDPPIFGIIAMATFDHLEVVDNIVHNAATGPNDKPLQSTALFVRGATDKFALHGLGFFPESANGATVMVGHFGTHIFREPAGAENVSVRGNRFSGAGRLNVVTVEVRGQCIMHDNHCQRETR
jgi:hypothetical protein